MKKTGLLLLTLLFLALAGAFAVGEEPVGATEETAAAGTTEETDEADATEKTAEGEELDEWTVLFYLCGSDLESKYGYATDNLEEILQVENPYSYLFTIAQEYGTKVDLDAIEPIPKVNVLIQTGGSEAWHADRLDMDISPEALQRWRFGNVMFYDEYGELESVSGFNLEQTLPVRSMADPETLEDFIRWGVETCPAKKYALVLWDHGGGAKTGLIIDELYKGEVLYLYELKQALADAGIRFESLVIDACLMANLETAWAVKDSANWMVASEETVPGQGTAIREWLQELFNHPECDGEQLGRTICDMTQIKYANLDDEQARSLLTWSVIDLSRIDRLVEQLEFFFWTMDEIYRDYPKLMPEYAMLFAQTEEYGDGHQNMRDIGGMLYNRKSVNYLDRELRNNLLDAFSDAVVYAVRGAGRSAARGLSFCYPNGFSETELELYAKNCPWPHYLAFLDAVSDWTAPDWVYDTAERLPEIDTIDELQLGVIRRMKEGEIPGISVDNLLGNLHNVYYRLYRVDEETGQTLLMGRSVCSMRANEDGTLELTAHDPMHWPAIEGEPCTMELVLGRMVMNTFEVEYLYNIPVQIDDDICYLRCGRKYDLLGSDAQLGESYEIYGVWTGYEENTEMIDRNVKTLAQLAGQNYRLLYPLDTGDGEERRYQFGEELRLYRALDVERVALPAGTYYLEYEIEDMLLRSDFIKRIELYWDGETITYPENFEWSDDEWRKLSDLK